MPAPNEPRFTGLLGEELRQLGNTGRVRIFSAGDPGDGFYVVESGRVRISAVVGNDQTRVLAMIGAGYFFGEMAVLDDAPRSATAHAEEETEAFL